MIRAVIADDQPLVRAGSSIDPSSTPTTSPWWPTPKMVERRCRRYTSCIPM